MIRRKKEEGSRRGRGRGPYSPELRLDRGSEGAKIPITEKFSLSLLFPRFHAAPRPPLPLSPPRERKKGLFLLLLPRLPSSIYLHCITPREKEQRKEWWENLESSPDFFPSFLPDVG